MHEDRVEQIRREMGEVREAVAPRMEEYFDAWGIVGTRVGSGELMIVMNGGTDEEVAALENAVLAAAAEILRERAAG